ncbi:hypothetical protein INT47_003130 [Mucor saturninus]|uniref:Methyltransferase domain-containing protein n=1 Tax=Mucor saturninus TaxID=64648 RepID=A0A8H7QLE4_9FUNG|nr:hypothetical protein INT47_003130 [Mucor saturninus]
MFDRKPSKIASITSKDESKELTDLQNDPRVGSSLPPLPISIAKDTDTNSSELPKPLIVNDRIYQNTKKYMLPIDDQEQDKLVQEHFLYKFIFGNNFSAPVRDLLSGHYNENPKRNSIGSSSCIIENISQPRILDIACGNGTWVLEMATEFPNSEFYGIDFSPGYPTTIKPANTSFANHDVLSPNGFPFPENYFDYVFMRQVYTCFSESDWTFVVREIRRVVKPGGFVEFRDQDPILRRTGDMSSALFKKYPDLMREKHEVNVFWARHMYDCLHDIGEMTDMQLRVNELRFGNSGPIGEMVDTSLRSGFESHRRFFEETYNKRDYDQMVEEIVNESIVHHSFFNYYVCWGRKPLLDYDSSCSSDRKLSVSTCSLPTRDEAGEKNDLNPSKLSIEWKDDSGDFTSLDADNVSDIGQFVEGFED